jgi:hypothetical protein
LMKEREERPCCGVSASHMVLCELLSLAVLGRKEKEEGELI